VVASWDIGVGRSTPSKRMMQSGAGGRAGVNVMSDEANDKNQEGLKVGLSVRY